MSRRRRPGSGFGRRGNALPALVLIGALAVLCGRPEKPGGPEPAGPTGGRPPPGEAPREAPRERAPGTLRVASVEDGDTFTLADGNQVRYLGIDTPERGEAFSREARDENHRLVRGRLVVLRQGGPQATDHYGRRLAIVHTDGVARDVGASVNAALLRAGLASVYLSAADAVEADVLRVLLAAQGEAIGARRGIWKRWLEGPGARDARFVATRLRLHVEGCPELREARPRPIQSLESACREGKSFCRTCKPLWDG